jgi:hypothetical protein
MIVATLVKDDDEHWKSKTLLASLPGYVRAWAWLFWAFI